MNNNTRNGGRQHENRSEGRPEGRQPQGNGHQPQQNRQWRNDNYRRDGQGYKSYNKDNRDNKEGRENFKTNNPQVASTKRIKTEETIDDIRTDISRIEKEIDLEIKQISTIRLGL